jgi:hypothetical protein
MYHRRSHSDPGDAVKDNDVSLDNDASLDNVEDEDDESVVSDTSSVHTVDLYTGWRFPDINFSLRIPAWFAILITLLLFHGPSTPPSCVE